jgi:hypothetical protein
VSSAKLQHFILPKFISEKQMKNCLGLTEDVRQEDCSSRPAWAKISTRLYLKNKLKK